MESHIFPKFAVKYHKKSGSKYLRQFIEPNKRIQDAIKLYLLSEKAEQEFSIREKWFSEKIFYPYINGKTELNYKEELFYFSISFLWRVLILNFKTEELSNKWYFDLLKNVEIEWRDFLTKKTYPRNFDKHYLFLTYDFEKNDTGIKGVRYYLARTFDATIVSSDNQENLMIYGKFNRFIFWSVIKGNHDLSGINGCQINPISGKLNSPQLLDYFPLNSFLGNRINGINKLEKPNELQQEKILKEVLKNPEKFMNSEVGRVLFKDYEDEK
ncbi:hypothetical protein [Tenacibaculum bernardetii]|uniref:hypothetical protein n=1 Tax=Tenacibaculum bernardetii TaxID=3021375 RepID=UPI0023B16BEC|nr:hypothetical protein [Tenacibaculum bernardetii]